MNQDQKSKIKNTTVVLMIWVSLFFDILLLATDLIDLIPGIGTFAGIVISLFIDILALLTFYIWFKIHGINFRGWKRVASFWGGFVLSWIPFVNIFAWTADVLLVVATIKAEETLEKVAPVAAKVVTKKMGGPTQIGPGGTPRTIVPNRPPQTPNTNTGDVREASNDLVGPSANNRPQEMVDIRPPQQSQRKAK